MFNEFKSRISVARPPSDILRSWGMLSVGMLLAAFFVGSGVKFTNPVAMIIAPGILSLLYAAARPLIIEYLLPFILLTAGLGVLVINAFLIWIVGNLGMGFVVTSFIPALAAALIMGLTEIILNFIFHRKGVRIQTFQWPPSLRRSNPFETPQFPRAPVKESLDGASKTIKVDVLPPRSRTALPVNSRRRKDPGEDIIDI